jgi:glycosyltransferase involved in cell wall biosynthesis
VSDKRSLKILAYVHGYFPNLNAGAEAMLHQILMDLKEKGHEVKVLTKNPGASEYEGIPLLEAGGSHDRALATWSDVIFTHLNYTRFAVKLAQRNSKPIVHLVHNDWQLKENKIMDGTTASLAVANSEWIRDTIKTTIPSLIVHPPTVPERYEVESSREAITLINLIENKGGLVFWELARIFPDKKFIGVKGGYGFQQIYDKDLSNVTIVENTTDIQSVYKKSRIVLMPSSYESWGRVGMEAACSGIPVIASPTPGLKESLGDAGIFARHYSVADWVEAIRFLDNPKNYKKYSELTKKRSIELANKFKEQMKELEEKLLIITTSRK